MVFDWERRAFYEERDGVWLLDMEGVIEKSKLDEFPANNTALLRQPDEHRKRLKGIDPDEIRRLAEGQQRLKEDWDRAESVPTESERWFTEELDLVHPRWSGVAFHVAKAGLHFNGDPGLISRARSTDL